MKTNSKTPLVALFIAIVSLSCNGQQIHPYKKKFGDFANWPSTTPKDINFENFQPFRAVYSRSYTSMQGHSVNDKVIITAQRVWWYGKKAILFEFHDAGTPEFDYTNGRTQFYYLDEQTLQMYMAVGPKLTTAQDYTTVRVQDDKITTTKVNTATGEVEFSELETKDPSFAFRQIRFMMWAAMDLNIGDKIKLEPLFHAPQGIQGPAIAIVEEQVDYTTPDDKKYQPYVVESTNNGDDAIVNKFFIINEAPYLLAQGLYNADDDEIYRWWLKLEEWELLDGK